MVRFHKGADKGAWNERGARHGSSWAVSLEPPLGSPPTRWTSHPHHPTRRRARVRAWGAHLGVRSPLLDWFDRELCCGTLCYRRAMVSTPDEELIESAQAVLNPHHVRDRVLGDVGATLVTDRGNRYSGVCIDTGSGTGFCAEHSAIAAMVTTGEYRIAKIVAVWRDNEGALYALPPCGRCREFMRQVDPANLDADVILDRNTTAKLSAHRSARCRPRLRGTPRREDVESSIRAS